MPDYPNPFLLTPLLAQQDAPPNPPVDLPAMGPNNDPTATTTQGPGSMPPAAPAQPPPRVDPFLWIVVVMVAVLMFFTIGGQKKEKKKRAAMLAAIKKGDKVQTVGGALGTVIELRDEEVVVKVDENNNTRIKFVRSAIQSVVQEE
jgi:preprotein translocase subunit YajC